MIVKNICFHWLTKLENDGNILYMAWRKWQKMPTVNVDSIAKLFNGVTAEILKHPTGKVKLLNGTDYCEILSVKISQVGKLQL